MVSDSNYFVCDMKENHIYQIADIEKENFSEPWSDVSIKESAQNNTKFFVCADESDTVLGYVGLNYVLDEGYITSVCVDKNHRNKGIATLLFERCFLFAEKNGLSFISLEVRKSNEKAISLYEKLNFSNVGLRKNFYSYPREDALIYTRRF